MVAILLNSSRKSFKMFLYVITNRLNGKRYVGQAVDPVKRWNLHLFHAKAKDGKLYRAMRLHGVINFEYVVVACVLRKEWINECEVELIRSLDTYQNGYNATVGGEGTQGFGCTDERRRKIAASKIGKSRSVETIEKMRRAATGKVKPEHVKEILRRKMTGRFVSAATRAKISSIHKGKKLSMEHRQRLSEFWSGNKLSEATRAKIAEAHRGRKRSPETCHRLSLSAVIREQQKRESGFRVSDDVRRRISESMKSVRRIENDHPSLVELTEMF